ncbi:hypothetical protein LguiA_005217 [Lonicera macranthoides]
MSKEAIIGHNRIEDVRWLCSLSESELDMLIGLKTLVIRRAKKINHEALYKKFGLKIFHALGFVLMEYLKGQLQDSSAIPDLTECFACLDECNLLKFNLDIDFGTMSIEGVVGVYWHR